METQFAMLRILIVGAIGCFFVAAQTKVDLQHQSRGIDFSDATYTKPARTGTALPATCLTGEAFILMTAPAGANFFICTATDTWSLQSPAPGGDLAGELSSAKVVAVQNRTVSAAAPSEGQALVWNASGSQWEPRAVAIPGTYVGLTSNDTITGVKDMTGAGWKPPAVTVANLLARSAALNAGQVFLVTDALSTRDCDTGGGDGTISAWCYSNGTAFVPLSSTGATSLTRGVGNPAAACLSYPVMGIYLDQSTGDFWACTADNAWRRIWSTDNSGPLRMTAQTGLEPETPASGNVSLYFSTDKIAAVKDDAGNISTTVRGGPAVANQFVRTVTATGTVVRESITSADLPAPTASTGGVVQAKMCSTGQFVNAIGTDSTVSCGTPNTGSGGSGGGKAVFAGPYNVSQAANATTYYGLNHNSSSSTEDNVALPVPYAGTFSNLRCRTNNAQQAAGDLIITLRVNKGSGFVDSTLQITVAANSAAGIFSDMDAFAVSQNDLVDLKIQHTSPSGTAAARITGCTLEFQ